MRRVCQLKVHIVLTGCKSGQSWTWNKGQGLTFLLSLGNGLSTILALQRKSVRDLLRNKPSGVIRSVVGTLSFDGCVTSYASQLWPNFVEGKCTWMNAHIRAARVGLIICPCFSVRKLHHSGTQCVFQNKVSVCAMWICSQCPLGIGTNLHSFVQE